MLLVGEEIPLAVCEEFRQRALGLAQWKLEHPGASMNDIRAAKVAAAPQDPKQSRQFFRYLVENDYGI